MICFQLGMKMCASDNKVHCDKQRTRTDLHITDTYIYVLYNSVRSTV